MSEKKGFFSRLKDGLTKTRDNFVAGIDNIFNLLSYLEATPSVHFSSVRLSNVSHTL